MRTTTAVVALLAAASTAQANCPSPPSNAGYLWLSGINIAGFEFGTDTNGNSDLSKAYPPIGGGNPNGYGQVQHFRDHANMNTFRYPVSWQYLINSNKVSTSINMDNFGKYNGMIQQCLRLGARCIVDVHNYARFQGTKIGDPGTINGETPCPGCIPPQTFADFWGNLASQWKNDPNRDRIIFELMNEPHDIDTWAWTSAVGAAVRRIRQVMGDNNNIILLPGTDWTHSQDWVSLNTGPNTIAGITNNYPNDAPGHEHDNLIFSIHDYFQGDNASPTAACTNVLSSVASNVACWLRQNRRQAMFTEVGGGKMCVNACMSSLRFLAQNSDVFIGYTAWSAGSFDSNYIMGMTPDQNWNDHPLVQQCYSKGPQYISGRMALTAQT